MENYILLISIYIIIAVTISLFIASIFLLKKMFCLSSALKDLNEKMQMTNKYSSEIESRLYNLRKKIKIIDEALKESTELSTESTELSTKKNENTLNL